MAEPETVTDLAIDPFDGLESSEAVPPSGNHGRALWA